MIPFARLSLNAQPGFANRPRKPTVSREAMAWPGVSTSNSETYFKDEHG